MKISSRFTGALLLACASTAGAQAATLLSENFAAASGGLYSGAIGGTLFSVTLGSIDIVGLPSGSPFSCVHNPGGNCLDLVGNTGTGAIASVPTFNLLAGMTYTVSFGALLQGFAPGDPTTTSYRVSLGSFASNLAVNSAGANVSLNFTALANETAVRLRFETLAAPNSVHGAVLDNIVLSAVPEPGTWALMLAGMGSVLLLARRRAA
jgi:hypothetical protein